MRTLPRSPSMACLRFHHGVEIDIGGPLRVVQLADGYHVIGNGMLLPCDDREEAERRLDEFTNPKKAWPVVLGLLAFMLFMAFGPPKAAFGLAILYMGGLFYWRFTECERQLRNYQRRARAKSKGDA